jgi:hypothetical protein
MIYNMTEIEDGRIRIIIVQEDNSPNQGEVELGTLYFERAKKTFQRKPITMNGWACVDAKIDGLYEMGGEITPKEIVAHCQDIIRMNGY